MQFSKKLLVADYRFPEIFTQPANYTTELLASTSGATYTTYTVPWDGWYIVEVLGGGGGKASDAGSYSSGGYINKMIYLYQGEHCLLWSGEGPQSKGHTGACGYPGTQDNTFGGRGAVGYTVVTQTTPNGSFTTYIESGASGGGGANRGVNGDTTSHTGGAGAGSGFLAGFVDKTMWNKSVTLGSMTVNLNRNLSVGSLINYSCITTYLIGAGGGGSANDNGSYRASGGGGGAFGNGGTTYKAQTAAQSGPAGAWGKGEDGGHYGGGTRGAWAIVDFSTDTFDWGLGGGAVGATGYCRLYKVIPN